MPAPRRTVLALDCLEDRRAPAVAILGSLAIDIVPPTTHVAIVDAAPGPRDIQIVAAPARLDDVPIGFMHPFAQNGFIGGEFIERQPAPPRPLPVQPPSLPVSILPTPDAADIPEPPMAIQPAAVQPAAVRPAAGAPAPLETPREFPKLEPAPTQINDLRVAPPQDTASAFDDDLSTPPRLHTASAVLTAIGLLLTRTTPERRKPAILHR